MIELPVVLGLLFLGYVALISYMCINKNKGKKGVVSSQRPGAVIVKNSKEEYKLELSRYTDYFCGSCVHLSSSEVDLPVSYEYTVCKKYCRMIIKKYVHLGYVRCGSCFKECFNIESIYLKQDIEHLNECMKKASSFNL